MEKLNISDELLQSLSIDQLAELKIEMDSLLERINSLLEDCNNELNS